MPGGKIVANGINGLTGEYLVPPVDTSELANLAKGAPPNEDVARWLKTVWDKVSQPSFGLPWNIDPMNPAQAGWALVFAFNEDEAIRDAMAPLVAHRQARIGERVKLLNYLPGESWRDWLARQGTGPGSVDPQKVPYYVLLVGNPSQIPFAFQYLLDVEYAVGRIHFDSAEGYTRYVQSLIAYETAPTPPHDRSAVFFGTRHPFDDATQLSADSLVGPLANGDPATGDPGVAAPWGYQTHLLLGAAATKSALAEVLSGTSPAGRPSLVFSATHGMGGWPPGHPDQRAKHGALLCQDWPGIGVMKSDHYLGASDVAGDARFHGLMAFFFACYGAGTPKHDEFMHQPGTPPPLIAEEAFVAALPKALLSHPQGGALAVVGHIERSWGYSFASPAGRHLIPFRNALGQILVGRPIGYSMKDFNEKYAALSANLSQVLKQIALGLQISDDELATLWTERNDAQNYVLIGDPAARLTYSGE